MNAPGSPGFFMIAQSNNKYCIGNTIMTFTTTTTWLLLLDKTHEQAQEIKDARQNAAVAIAGEEYRHELERSFSFDGSNRTLIVRRTWPDLAAAEAWVTYSLNEGALAAVVDDPV